MAKVTAATPESVLKYLTEIVALKEEKAKLLMEQHKDIVEQGVKLLSGAYYVADQLMEAGNVPEYEDDHENEWYDEENLSKTDDDSDDDDSLADSEYDDDDDDLEDDDE